MPEPIKLNPDWLDVEFEQPAGYIAESAGEETFGISWPSSLERWSKNEWKDVKDQQIKDLGTDRIGRLYLEPYNDQSPESSCVLNATECGYRYKWNQMLGRQFELKWSPMWMYQFICSGRHSGSYTMDAMRFITETGACPESSSNKSSSSQQTLAHERVKALCPHHYHQNTPYRGRRQYEEAKSTAKYFRVDQWISLQGDDEFASALLHRMPIINGRTGHSICHCDLIWDGRDWYSEYLDSYDKDRGDNGRLYDSRRMWSTSGAWAVYSIHLPANPLKPCGPDTKEISKSEYQRLYPDLTEEQIDFYMSL